MPEIMWLDDGVVPNVAGFPPPPQFIDVTKTAKPTSNDGTIGGYLNKSVSILSYPNVKYNIPNRDVLDVSAIGIEMEIENIENPIDGVFGWYRKQDGSLRNNGYEYVTDPIKGEDINRALSLLRRALFGQNDPKFSSRTSVHIHLNVMDMTFEQLRTLVLLYLCFERCLYELVGKHRYQNIFCVPITQAGMSAKLHSFLNNGNWKECSGWEKYTGLHLGPVLGTKDVHAIGTVEFRHMPGTFDIDKIILWINLIQCLKLSTMKWSFEELSNEILMLNTNSQYDMFLSKIFGNFAEAFQNPTTHKNIELDTIFVKECLLQAKNPMFSKSKFEHSLLGKYILRKENIFDKSCIYKEIDPKLSANQIRDFLEAISKIYPSLTGNDKDIASKKYRALEAILLKQCEKEIF